MKKEIVIAAIFIALGLVALGLSLRSGIKSNIDRERVVSVKGLCEKEVPADKVIWTIIYKNVNDDLPSMMGQIEKHTALISDFLKKNGIDLETEVIYAVPEIVDLKAERYVSDNIAYRYNATSFITVSSNQVDLVRQLMIRQSELMKQGVTIVKEDYRFSNQFIFTKLNEIKPQMIAEATKNARAAAEKFAADSDSKLGKIRKADQGTFTISDRDASTPHIKTIRVVTKLDYYLKD